jgi:hypothetical protein
VYCWVLFTDAPVIMLYVALGLIGGYRGFNNPAVESIFADSVATGQRCDGWRPAVAEIAVERLHWNTCAE